MARVEYKPISDGVSRLIQRACEEAEHFSLEFRERDALRVYIADLEADKRRLDWIESRCQLPDGAQNE